MRAAWEEFTCCQSHLKRTLYFAVCLLVSKNKLYTLRCGNCGNIPFSACAFILFLLVYVELWDEIEATNKNFVEAFNSGDPRKVAAVRYHEDCHVMLNGMEVQHGREGEHSAVKDVSRLNTRMDACALAATA